MFAGYLPGYHGDVIRPEDAVISLFWQISIPEGHKEKNLLKYVKKVNTLNLSWTTVIYWIKNNNLYMANFNKWI